MTSGFAVLLVDDEQILLDSLRPPLPRLCPAKVTRTWPVLSEYESR